MQRAESDHLLFNELPANNLIIVEQFLLPIFLKLVLHLEGKLASESKSVSQPVNGCNAIMLNNITSSRRL